MDEKASAPVIGSGRFLDGFWLLIDDLCIIMCFCFCDFPTEVFKLDKLFTTEGQRTLLIEGDFFVDHLCGDDM